MGYYINPETGNKEDWLKDHGQSISTTDLDNFDFTDNLPVCLVNNGAFTAAGIAFDIRELAEFNRPDDIRSRKWYSVSRDNLKPFYPSKRMYD